MHYIALHHIAYHVDIVGYVSVRNVLFFLFYFSTGSADKVMLFFFFLLLVPCITITYIHNWVVGVGRQGFSCLVVPLSVCLSVCLLRLASKDKKRAKRTR